MRSREIMVGRSDMHELVRMVDQMVANDWSVVRLSGDKDLHRPMWFEAMARGIEVQGYKPTPQDLEKLAEMKRDARPEEFKIARSVADDYYRRVIPALERERNGLLLQRVSRFALSPMDPKREALDIRTTQLDLSISKCIDVLDTLRLLNDQKVKVRPVYEDGIVRYDMSKNFEIDRNIGMQR